MKNQLNSISFIRDTNGHLPSKKNDGLHFYQRNRAYLQQQHFLVPNIVEFMHDVTENGQIGALKKRILQLNIFDIVRLMWWNKSRILTILKKEFAAGILILLQIEVLYIQKNNPSTIILSDYITDLALALNNQAIYKNFAELMKEIHKPLCFFTNNLPLFVDKCLEWGINPDEVYTPINITGYEMNPSQAKVEEYLERIPKEKLVAVVTFQGAAQTRYLENLKISKILINWFD